MKSKISNHNLHLRDTLGFFLTTNRISKILFGQNRSIIFNRAVTRKVLEYFDGGYGHQADRNTGNLGYGFIHYALILNVKPERVLCIGSKKGFIPAICALACQENKKGVVDFVDAGYGLENPNNWCGVAWWKRKDPEKHFSFLDINHYLKTYVMTSQEFADLYNFKYQYIYIDGDHSYEGIKKDYQLFWPRLTKSGFMAFHDVTVKKQPKLPPFGVWKFWEELHSTYKTIFPKSESGLGILQKM